MKRGSLIAMLCVAALAARAPGVAAQSVWAQINGAPTVGDPGMPAVFKYLHFLAGVSLGLSAAGLVHALTPPEVPGDSPWLLPLVAFATAAAAGAGKEVLDSTGFGDPRFSDFVVTSVGGLAAAGIVAWAQSAYPPTAAGRMNDGAFVFTTAALFAIPVLIGFAREVASYVERRRRLPASAADAPPPPARCG